MKPGSSTTASSSHKILLVGEGDFSFSLCLAKAFGSAKNIVATSLDSQGFLYLEITRKPFRTFRSCKEVIAGYCIASMQRTWLYMKNSVTGNSIGSFSISHMPEFIPGDSRANQLMRHQKLVRSFFENARRMLEVDGEIHVTHKSNGFHFQWNLKELASQSDLRLIEEVDFKREDYPGYSNKYGFDTWSFSIDQV